MRTGRTGSITVAAALLVLAPSAHAYLDPSTGSMILSAIVGVFATAALALKTFWYRIKALFRRSAEPPPAQPPAPPEAGPTAD